MRHIHIRIRFIENEERIFPIIQIVNGEWYRQKAYEQHNRDREITPKRGAIYDRNGNELAVSATVEKVVISPQEIKKSGKSKEYIAKTLATFLELDDE